MIPADGSLQVAMDVMDDGVGGGCEMTNGCWKCLSLSFTAARFSVFLGLTQEPH